MGLLLVDRLFDGRNGRNQVLLQDFGTAYLFEYRLFQRLLLLALLLDGLSGVILRSGTRPLPQVLSLGALLAALPRLESLFGCDFLGSRLFVTNSA